MLSWLGAVIVGGVVGHGCGDLEPGVPLVAARCDPSSMAPDNCLDLTVCCSDDPATVAGPEGEPLFFGEHNERSRSGFCVRVSDIAGQGLSEPEGCPIPCNPTWYDQVIDAVCGSGRQCCQSVELHEDDCVFDSVQGRWRPADGRDALASLEGGGDWRPTPNSTHQDPDFAGCEAHAGGDRGSQAFRDCVVRLGTAAHRGYCMALGLNQRCPAEEADYIDACEAMN
ncbi:hypothetical protein [Paraliomyxa miuraensis]|uniref:hypothetical protein n=1 Tax=Paraliomyxa miuraensis TaxID=376150 RepID=UPI0022571228|nr:hypothetical protein [Paraliomyxa miuraensis]MCX4240930.1 hypothetical protein [Paraliomyxa miuraensis]